MGNGMQRNVASAAADKDWEKVRQLIEEGENVDTVGGWFRATALHHACRWGNKDICAFLLSRGANVSLKNEDGDQPLHVAARSHDAEICQLLVEHQAAVTSVNHEGETPLLIAVGWYSPAVCRPLITNDSLNVADRYGNQALHIASRKGYVQTVQLLVNCGAHTNAMNKNGQTPLHTAAGGAIDCPELCSILLEHHAKINAFDKDGNQPLHLACKQHHTATANFLLSRGAAVNALNKEQKQLLHLANEPILKSDQEHGVDAGHSTSTARASRHVSAPTVRTETTRSIQQCPTNSVGKEDDELVQQLIQQIEQLTQDGLAKDRQIAEVRQQTEDLQKALLDDQLQRERAVTEERREKEALEQRLTREHEDKVNIETELAEVQRQVAHISAEKEDLERLFTEDHREKTNIEELLSDAEAAIERNKQREEGEVLKISSLDIQLTDTVVGGGSYGVVHVGYWRGCCVAVKVLYGFLAASRRNIELLQQEASVGWKIHHPNIAAVCGVTLELEDDRNKKAWIIMELHSGSMSDVIDACHGDVGHLTLREMIDMTHDSLCGLDYIHSLQPTEILHGDICPRNILVTAAMRAKLGDLGAARFHDASLSAGLLSPPYTAPERCAVPPLPKSKQTDMYSMGVAICELFTSLSPNRQKRMDQVLLIRHRNVRSLCKHLLRDDPATRPTAFDAQNIISRIRETDDYRTCPPKRMVKGKVDGIDEVTLLQLI